MLTLILAAGLIVGLFLGWKLRGFWDKRPRILGGKPKPAEPSKDGRPGSNGVVDRLGRTGERLVGKGVELVFGKPKGPKDDKEDE